MQLELVPLLRCPACETASLTPQVIDATDDGRCQTGVLACDRCSAWYPISGFVLDLLPEGRERPGLREDFLRRHGDCIGELSLRPPAERPAADPGFRAQAQQRDHFDELAGRDDEFSYRALSRLPFQIALRRLTFEGWREQIERASVLLDIGCADGLSTFDAARPGTRVLAFDISRESVVRATARARELGLANVSFFVADADAIPVIDGGVDCALCYGSLHHVPDPARTLAEADRVLRPGGSYLGVENNRTPLRPIFDLLMRLRPLWREQAGAEAQMGAGELERWTADSTLMLEVRPIVFVPPHLCNRLGERRALLLLRWTDSVIGRIPLLRRWGGLIAIEGRKRARAAQPARANTRT